MMRKSILLAALAATLLVTSGVTWGASDNTGTMQDVVATSGSSVTRTTADDVLPGGTTVAVGANSAITGGPGTSGSGGLATYTVTAGNTLSAATGQKLTLTGGAGGGSDGGVGGEATLGIASTGSFYLGDGASFIMTAGSNSNASGGGGVIDNAGTITFAKGSIFTVSANPRTKVTNSGTFYVDGGLVNDASGTNNAVASLLNLVANTGSVTVDGALTKDVGSVTMTNGSGQVTINVASFNGSNNYTFGAFDAGGNTLFISPNASTSTNPLTFTGAVQTARATYNSAESYAIGIAENASVEFKSTVTATNGHLLIGQGADVKVTGSNMMSTLTNGDILIGIGAKLVTGGAVISAGDLVIDSGANVKVSGTTQSAKNISINDNAKTTFTGAVSTTANNGNLTIGKNVTATFGSTVGLPGTGEFIAGQDSTVTATGAVTADKITITGADVEFKAGTVGGAGGIAISNGSYVTIGNGALIGNVAVNSSTLITSDASSAITGDLTTTGNSVIKFGQTAGALLDLAVSGATSLSANTQLAIDPGVTAAGDTTLFSTGSLDATAWYAANKGITGSANQTYTFDITGNAISAKDYEKITTYNAQSRTNIINRMTALGVNNAGSLVVDSFGLALFNVANGTDGGDPAVTPTNPNGVGIASGLTGQARQDAQTTWTILRTFAGSTGGGSGSPIEVSSAASIVTGQNQTAAVSSLISFANNNIIAVNNRIAANNVARAKVSMMAGSDAALASAMLNSNFANRFWMGGLGMWEDAGSRDGSNGYKLDTWGLMTGYDHAFGPVTVGGSLGYSRGKFEEKNVLYNNSKINNYSFNLYATYNHRSGFFASILGGYAYSDVALRRSVLVGGYEASDYHVNTWNIGTNIGYDMRPMQNLTVTPCVGLYYIRAKSNTISGTYASIADIKDNATQLPIELSVTYRVPMANGGLDLTARGGYAYNFNNNGADGILTYNNIVGVDPVSIKGRTPGRHTWNAGGGVKYQAGRFDMVVSYDYYSKSSYHAHRVTGAVGMSF